MSAGTVLDVVTQATPAAVAAGLATVASLDADRVTHQVVAQVIPGLLVVFAAVLLAFGIPKLVRRRAKRPTQEAPAAPEPVPVAAGIRPTRPGRNARPTGDPAAESRSAGRLRSTPHPAAHPCHRRGCVRANRTNLPPAVHHPFHQHQLTRLTHWRKATWRP